jgi:hypothetical protein
VAGASLPPPPVPAQHLPVLVRLVHAAPLRLRGPVTGVIYDFTPAQPVQSVDPGDAPAMLRDGLFAVVAVGDVPIS